MYSFQIPFREAHGLSGKCVSLAETKNCQLSQLTVRDLKTVRYSMIKYNLPTCQNLQECEEFIHLRQVLLM